MIEARIVALAQLYVALTRGRCCRLAVSPQRAISVLHASVTGVTEPTALRASFASIESYPSSPWRTIPA